MIITSIKTPRIIPFSQNIIGIIERAVCSFQEKSILVITSKIISLCEGQVIKTNAIDKNSLIEKEADYFLPSWKNQYGITLTIKNDILIPSAGIDESNAAGYYVLWPKNPQETANEIRKYLCSRFKIKKAGVIITDSTTAPLRLGTTGIAIAHSGFRANNNYIGKMDLFGRKLQVTKANIVDGLAAAAVVVMGEGNEQTPLAIICDVPFVVFQARNPVKKELQSRKISIQKDVYSLLLMAIKWKTKKERF